MYDLSAQRRVSSAGTSPVRARVPKAETRAPQAHAPAPNVRQHALERISILQMIQKQGPAEQGPIDVTEIGDYVPNCVDDSSVPDRKTYRRTGGITSGWNDTDLFYADGAGPLVQITRAMVNDYWDPKYEGFAHVSGPDWIVNCEDYAKAAGFGTKVGDYTSTETLSEFITANGNYVLELSYHWMRVAKTGANALTIKQKDGESAVYTKDFTLAAGLEYILNKRSAGGTVYHG